VLRQECSYHETPPGILTRHGSDPPGPTPRSGHKVHLSPGVAPASTDGAGAQRGRFGEPRCMSSVPAGPDSVPAFKTPGSCGALPPPVLRCVCSCAADCATRSSDNSPHPSTSHQEHAEPPERRSPIFAWMSGVGSVSGSNAAPSSSIDIVTPPSARTSDSLDARHCPGRGAMRDDVHENLLECEFEVHCLRGRQRGRGPKLLQELSQRRQLAPRRPARRCAAHSRAWFRCVRGP